MTEEVPPLYEVAEAAADEPRRGWADGTSSMPVSDHSRQSTPRRVSVSFDPTPAVIGADASARPSHRTSASSGLSVMEKAASTAAAEAGSRQPAGESSTLQQRLAQLFGAEEPPVPLWAPSAELDEGSSSASHRAQDGPVHLR